MKALGHPFRVSAPNSLAKVLSEVLLAVSTCGALDAGQPHRSLVFASQRGRAEVLPGPGTSYAPELAMSRPDVAPASLNPAVEALDAAQPSQSPQTLEQPAVEPPASIRLEQVRTSQHL